MASGKVARRADASEISALLDSPEVAALIAELEALRWTGRRGYGPRTLVGACLIKSLYGFTTWTRAAALIADHPGLQAAIGGCPSVFACYRFATKLREHSNVLADCLDRIAASLQADLPEIGRDVAPLLDAVRSRGFRPQTCAMDKGYDNPRVMYETRERGCVPIVALRKTSPIPLDRIPYGSPEWKRIYRGRAAVEREFGRLKNEYALTPLRTRGLDRVTLHADLVMLARLGQALSRARAVPLAA